MMPLSEFQIRASDTGHAKVTIEYANGRRIEIEKAAVDITQQTPEYSVDRNEMARVTAYRHLTETLIEVRPLGEFRFITTDEADQLSREVSLEEFYRDRY